MCRNWQKLVTSHKINIRGLYMTESLRLDQEQRLVQRLSPMQVKFVKLLEMNSPEAEEAVRRELDDNPALSAGDESSDMGEGTDSEESFNESAEEMQRADYADEDDVPYYRLDARNYSPDDKGFDFIQADTTETLYDYLSRQIDEREVAEEVAVIAKYIIGNLDSNGYLRRPLMSIIDDMAFNQGIEVSDEQAREAYNEVRSLEPAGIGATDLQDCLSMQILSHEEGETRSDALRIISDYFSEFSLRHFDRIMSHMKLKSDRFQKALKFILGLNPKPGASIGYNSNDNLSQQIIPDFIIEIEDNDLRITLNNNIPELHIEESFQDAVKRMENNAKRREEQGKEFIISRYNEARDFIDAMKMRQETLFAVISAIVKIQRQYFLTEDEHELRPMGLKDVSDITGYDLSVVSRSTANKYLSTPWGIIPLKFFFSEGVGEGEDEASAREIQAAIKKIVEQEDKRHPLSDDKICKALSEKGYAVRRRTVSKYRDRLGIAVARLRRES